MGVGFSTLYTVRLRSASLCSPSTRPLFAWIWIRNVDGFALYWEERFPNVIPSIKRRGLFVEKISEKFPATDFFGTRTQNSVATFLTGFLTLVRLSHGCVCRTNR